MDRDAPKCVCGGRGWGVGRGMGRKVCEKYFPSTNKDFVRNMLLINY